MLHKQEEFVCPKRTLSEWIEKLKQTVTVEEITEEEVDPIYLRMTRYNFYHSWDESRIPCKSFEFCKMIRAKYIMIMVRKSVQILWLFLRRSWD